MTNVPTSIFNHIELTHFFQLPTGKETIIGLPEYRQADTPADFEKVYQMEIKKSGVPENEVFRQNLSDKVGEMLTLENSLPVKDRVPELQYRANEFLKWLKNQQQPGKKADVPGVLKEIFINDAAYKEAIRALQEVTPPVIDKNMNYLLGQKQKSVFTAWVEVLKQRGKIRDVSYPLLAELLNNEIHWLNLSLDGKTLRTPKNTVHRTTAYNRYRNALLKKIPS